MKFLLAPGTGPGGLRGFGAEIEGAPALEQLTVIDIWDGKGTGQLVVILHSGARDGEVCWVPGSGPDWLGAQRRVLKCRISRELAR